MNSLLFTGWVVAPPDHAELRAAHDRLGRAGHPAAGLAQFRHHLTEACRALLYWDLPGLPERTEAQAREHAASGIFIAFWYRSIHVAYGLDIPDSPGTLGTNTILFWC